ncbi:MAG TPA: TolC family protein, partial [Hyphomicrobiaceae bacterium]|nr:TolC family protein [Hyphomicrobiaceae bacterium]
ANAAAVALEAEGRLREAETLFRSVTGRAPGKLASVSFPANHLPRSIDAAVAEAIAAAPSVIATAHDATAAHAAVGVAHSRHYPRLNLELSSNHGWNVAEDHDRSIDARAMLVVRWNLLNGGIDKAREWEARARALEASEISENTKRIVERETRASWNAVDIARSRIPLLVKQVHQTRLTRAAYGSQFDAGQRRLLDLLNIQAEVFLAEAALRTEELVRLYNSYRLLAAMGRLVPALGLEPPREAVMPHAPTVIDGWRDGFANWRPTVTYHVSPVPSAPAKPVK